MRRGQLVRIKRSDLDGETGLLGTVQGTVRGAAGPYVMVSLPSPYGVSHMCATDLESVVVEEQEFVTVEGRYGVVLERKEGRVRVQFDRTVDWVDPAKIEPSSPEELLVNDVMTR